MDANRTEANLRAALYNSTSELEPLRSLVWQLGLQKKWDQVDEVFRSIGGRFAGHPGLPVLQAKNSMRKGDLDSAERSYGEALGIQPDAWEARKELGTLLFERAQVAKAAELFTAYPGFKKGSTEHRVAVANNAFEAGSLFYWSGNFAQALPLYRIAADLQTGSEGSLSSETRIALIDGDFATAMAISLDRARRYQSPYAYRDYLSMLHAAGRSTESWDGFNSLVGRMTQPQIWESVLVGHRIEGKSEAEIGAWAGLYRKSGHFFSHAAMYALRAAVTDRPGTDELPTRIAALDRPVWMIRGTPPSVVRPSVDGQSQLVLGPNAPRPATLPSAVFDRGPKAQIKSDLVRFAEAYRAIRKGELATARSILEEAVTFFDPVNVNLGYLLPYLAYASVKSRDTAALQTALARFAPQDQRFDYHLANAVLQASAGKAGDALQSLRLALHRRPYTESRPLMTEYQLAEVSEWIYQMTRDAKIKEFVLGWAKANQTFQPWHAWAYALEAKLAPNGPARTRAIALAHYLDKDSEHLVGVPKRDVDAAVKEFSGKNPFLRPKPPAAKKESA
jgi:tetratricopeptide (TPR) repeat protein